MARTAVRLRALLAIVILVTMSWGAITVLGDHGCEGFSTDETRALASLPVTPACVQATVPASAPLDQLQNQLDQLSSPTPGVSQSP
jgi:glycine cleavage system regulatory protein